MSETGVTPSGSDEEPPGRITTAFVALFVIAILGGLAWEAVLEWRLLLTGDRIVAPGYCQGFPIHRGADCVVTLIHPSVPSQPVVHADLSLVQMARIGFSVSQVKTEVELMWFTGRPETARGAGPPVVKSFIVLGALVIGARVLTRRLRGRRLGSP